MFNRIKTFINELIGWNRYEPIITDIHRGRLLCKYRYDKKLNTFEEVVGYGDDWDKTDYISNVVQYENMWFLNEDVVKKYIESKKEKDFKVNITHYKEESDK